MAQKTPSLVLELTEIERWYGDGPSRVHVLHGVDLSIAKGEAVAITGPSGSGKSTLLHVAGLLDRPDGGKVAIAGSNVSGRSDKALSGLRNKHLGFVYQHHHLLREFTAMENVLMPAMIGARNKVQGTRERAIALLEQVGLGHRVAHYPGQMSGGEQQRVALARALMTRPALLLADEPTGNLDPQTGDAVADMLFRLVETEGMSMLLVTHNPALAKRCDRQLKMNGGRLA